MFKCLNSNNYPSYRNKILQNTATHNYATRHRELFYVPRERLEICRKSFLNKGISLWNAISTEAKNLKTLKSFKLTIKNMLLENLFYMSVVILVRYLFFRNLYVYILPNILLHFNRELFH